LNKLFKNAVLNIALQCTVGTAKRTRTRMNRSRFEIMADIMQACLLPRGKTRIMCIVKLNFTQANEYLSQLTSLGLLSKEKGKYGTTVKGRQFISAYNRLGEIIGIPEPSPTGMKVFPIASASR
jgi:predicted transcriptional regulator